jgi:hypothetical protein
MFRPILVASPFVFAAVVSCGESSTLFDEITGGSAGTDAAISGTAMGGSDGHGGSSAKAGNTTDGGRINGGSSNGGSSNGGTTNKAGDSSAGGTSNNGGTANQNPGGTSADAGTTSEAAGGSPGGAPTGAAGMGAGGDGNGALCPDIFGDYAIRDAKGSCNNLSKNAPQSIESADVACVAHFVSDPADGPSGVNGSSELDANGNFKGATLFLNATPRSSCSGAWNAQSASMTVKCGMGPGDLCTIVLERK